MTVDSKYEFKKWLEKKTEFTQGQIRDISDNAYRIFHEAHQKEIGNINAEISQNAKDLKRLKNEIKAINLNYPLYSLDENGKMEKIDYIKRSEVQGILDVLNHALVSIKIMSLPQGEAVATNEQILKIMEASFQQAIKQFSEGVK